MDFEKLNSMIPELDDTAAVAAKAHWDNIAKPLGSLGLLERAVIKIAAITGRAEVRLNKRAVVVLCADNGVVKEGISQSGSEITLLVAET